MGKIGLHYGLQRATCRPGLRGGGESGIPAADCREYCCRLSGCLLPFGGMPGTSRADALHYIRTGIGTKQRRHRNKVWKAL